MSERRHNCMQGVSSKEEKKKKKSRLIMIVNFKKWFAVSNEPLLESDLAVEILTYQYYQGN